MNRSNRNYNWDDPSSTETNYIPVGFVLINKVNKTFVGKDSASGGYPFETNSIQSATIWRLGPIAGKSRLSFIVKV